MFPSDIFISIDVVVAYKFPDIIILTTLNSAVTNNGQTLLLLEMNVRKVSMVDDASCLHNEYPGFENKFHKISY